MSRLCIKCSSTFQEGAPLPNDQSVITLRLSFIANQRLCNLIIMLPKLYSITCVTQDSSGSSQKYDQQCDNFITESAGFRVASHETYL